MMEKRFLTSNLDGRPRVSWQQLLPRWLAFDQHRQHPVQDPQVSDQVANRLPAEGRVLQAHGPSSSRAHVSWPDGRYARSA